MEYCRILDRGIEKITCRAVSGIDRDFFQILPAEATELIDLVAGKSALNPVDFSRKFMLAEQATSVSLTYGKEIISDVKTKHLSSFLIKGD